MFKYKNTVAIYESTRAFPTRSLRDRYLRTKELYPEITNKDAIAGLSKVAKKAPKVLSNYPNEHKIVREFERIGLEVYKGRMGQARAEKALKEAIVEGKKEYIEPVKQREIKIDTPKNDREIKPSENEVSMDGVKAKLVEKLDLGKKIGEINKYEIYEKGEVLYRTMSKDHFKKLDLDGKMPAREKLQPLRLNLFLRNIMEFS